MTLLLVEVGRFVTEAALWIAVLVLVAGAAATVVLYPALGRPDPRHISAAVLVGGVVASLVHRFGTGLVWAPTVGDRPLPVVWAAVGAAATAVVIVMRRTSRDTRS